jgi:anti-anti-sigma regulatory factor
MLRIQRTTDRAAVVLTVSGRLGADNVSELCEAINATSSSTTVMLDLTDLVLADRDVVRLLREFEACKRIVLRNCPAYIRSWMSAESDG